MRGVGSVQHRGFGDGRGGFVLSFVWLVLGCTDGSDTASGPAIEVSGRINDAVLGSNLSGVVVCGEASQQCERLWNMEFGTRTF